MCVGRGEGVGRGGELERLAMVKTNGIARVKKNGMEPPRRQRVNIKRVSGGGACLVAKREDAGSGRGDDGGRGGE